MTERDIAPKRRKPPQTIRSQLLVAVNSSLAIMVVVFLAYDYRREFEERLVEKRIALEEEAKTMMPAVLEMSAAGAAVVQGYIDAVCGRMQDSQSPGHHIAVRLPDGTLQAVAHHRASAAILDAMQRAARSADRRAPFNGTELVVGACERQGVQVLVSERLDHLRRASRADVLGRLIELLVLAVVAAVVLNTVLWRVVTRPLRHLVSTVRHIASGELGAQAGSFRSAELNYLADEINQMSESLAAADHERALEMAKARKIQRHLQPAVAETPGLNVARLFVPAEEVAGDYYDVLPLADGTWLFCVADVTGHGVPAAMNAAILKMLLLHATERSAWPADILRDINQRYCKTSLLGDFSSMLLVRAHPGELRLEYASAGHETALLRSRSGETRKLPSTGLLLGLVPETDWETRSLTVGPTDRLLMVTDGVTEMFDAKRKMFGRDRLARLFASHQHRDVRTAVKEMEAAFASFRDGAPNHDDLTLVLVEFGSPGSD